MNNWCPENDGAWQAEMAAKHGPTDRVLRIRIKALEAESAALRADLEAAKEALQAIANQRKSGQVEYPMDHDWQDGFDIAVHVARDALAGLTTAQNKECDNG